MKKKSFGAGLDSLLQETSSTLKSKNIKDSKGKKLIQNKKTQKIQKPKWQQLLKVNVLMEDEQKIFLDNLAMTIMRKRAKGKNENRERITTNSLLRSFIRAIEKKSKALNIENIENEKELTERLTKLISR